MGLFTKMRKSQQPTNDDGTASDLTRKSRIKQKKARGHAGRKKQSLINQMGLTPSVAVTIKDAINGAEDILNSTDDFVTAHPLYFDNDPKAYYAVMLLDETSLRSSGLGKKDKKNKQTFGQLSNNLKSSSGSSGLVPLVTESSLQNNFFGLLPMHDAFEALAQYPQFAQQKWPIGLMSIDDRDVLSLEHTQASLSMDDWLAVVMDKIQFSIKNNRLEIVNELPNTSDELRFTKDEKDATKSQKPVEQVKPATTAQAPVPPTSPSQTNEPKNSKGPGTSIDDLMNPGSGEFDHRKKSIDNTANTNDDTHAVPPVKPSKDDGSRSQDKRHPATSDGPGKSDSVKDAKKKVDKQQQKASTQSLNSADQREAASATMDAQVHQLPEYNISISDKEFISRFVDGLSIPQFTLLDETDDPTGRKRAENKQLVLFNQELNNIGSNCKANLQQWGISQINGVLSGIEVSSNDESTDLYSLKQERQSLQQKLSDSNMLSAIANERTEEQQADLDSDFNQRKKASIAAALATVEAQYSEEQPQVRMRKQALVTKAIALIKQEIVTSINNIDKQIGKTTQELAATRYADMMAQGAGEFESTQATINQKYHEYSEEQKKRNDSSRESENKRVSDQAEAAKTDVTIAQLREQLADERAKNKSAVADATKQGEMLAKSAATAELSNKNAEIEHLHQIVNEQKETVKSLREEHETSKDLYEKLIKETEESHKGEAAWLHQNIKEADDKHDKDIRRTRTTYLAVIAIVALLFAATGFVSGELLISRAPATGTQNNQQPQTIVVPATNSNSTSQSSQNNSSEDSSSSTDSSSSKNDSSDSASKDKQPTKQQRSDTKQSSSAKN